MAQGISEIFGEGVNAEGGGVRVYRALRRLMCSACGATIPENSLFTRKRLPSLGLRIMPRCRECAPFELRSSDAEPQRSQLIENLLAPAGEKPQPDEKPSRKTNAEIESRLGPALSRAGKKRK